MSGSNNPLFGKFYSSESKLKMSLIKKGKPLNQAHKEKVINILNQNRDKLKLVNSE